MMFEHLASLFTSFCAFREQKPYHYLCSPISLDIFTEKKSYILEQELTQKSYAEIDNDFQQMQHPFYYKTILLR